MSTGWFNWFQPNKVIKFFTKDRISQDIIDKQKQVNSQALSPEELALGLNFRNEQQGYNNLGMSNINIQFEQYFANKAQRIAKYREMSFYPIISFALDNIADEAIVEPMDGDILELQIKEEFPEHINDEIRQSWQYLINDVYNYNDNAWQLFRKLLVDGELFVELILNSDGSDIIGIKVLPPHTMSPIYDGGIVVGYLQTLSPAGFIDINMTPNNMGVGTNSDNSRMFDKDQIIHIKYGEVGETVYDTRGYLEASIRIYNQLKCLEDAVVVYRICRAPERRVWNVYTGKMTPGKASERVKETMQQFRKRVVYDPNTGAMDSSQNFMSMIEDIWFAKSDDGINSTVETLPGGQNLGEIGDLQYFQRMLYTTLKLPSSRWNTSEPQMYNSGKSGEVTRDEIHFANFVARIQKEFKNLLVDSLMVLLRIRGIGRQYISDYYYNIRFAETNLYKQYKQLELLETKFALFGSLDSFIMKPNENPNGYFSSEFVLRKYFMMSDDDYDLNQKLLKKEKMLANLNVSAIASTSGTGGIGGGEAGFGAAMTGGEGFGTTTPEVGAEEFGAEQPPVPEAVPEQNPPVPEVGVAAPETTPATPESVSYKNSIILEQLKILLKQ